MNAMRSRFVFVLAFIAAACGLDLQGEAPVASDRGNDPDAALDGAPDGVLPDGALPDSRTDESDADATTSPGSNVVVSAGTVETATGLSQQTHLVYATGSARWWLFYIDSTDLWLLKTKSSPDLSTWTPGATLALPQPHGSDGRSFSVAYAAIAGQDVVHLTFSHQLSSTDHERYHTRATVSAGSIAFEAPNQVNWSNDSRIAGQDGTVTAIAHDHRVIDLSGWDNSSPGNSLLWRSTNLDLGTQWTAGFDSLRELDTVPKTVNARALVPLDSGDLLAFWEAADVEPDPSNVLFRGWSGGSWGSTDWLFTAATLNVDDWAVCRVSDTDVHAVRRSSAGAYEHRRYNGSSWSAGQAIPAEGALTGAGLVLLRTTQGVALVTIAGDASKSVRQTRWDGAAWSAWATVEGAAAERGYISGYGAPAEGKLAVIWTQKNGTSYDIVAAPVAP